MRTKENAQDYRYFPDPDLLPIMVDDQMIAKFRAELPELPLARAQRFISAHDPEYDAFVLTAEKDLADFYENTVVIAKNAKAASNWIMTELLRELNQAEKTILQSPISPKQLGEMICLIESGTI